MCILARLEKTHKENRLRCLRKKAVVCIHIKENSPISRGLLLCNLAITTLHLNHHRESHIGNTIPQENHIGIWDPLFELMNVLQELCAHMSKRINQFQKDFTSAIITILHLNHTGNPHLKIP